MLLVRDLANGGATPVDELWKRSGLALAAFAETLTTARDAQLVRVVHQSAEDIVELTEAGRELAKIVRPTSA